MTDLLQSNDELTIDETKNYLDQLVGEGRKFKTPEDLAKGKLYADQTIETMKRRLDELTVDYNRVREENMTKAKLEELISKFEQTPPSNEQPPVKDNNQPVDFNKIEEIVQQKIQQNRIADVEAKNLDTVKAKLIERFGPNYQSSVKQQIEAIGLTNEDFNSLAKKSPSALFRTLGLDQQPRDSFQTPPRSSQRTDNFAPTADKKRTWSYYQDLKKTKPDIYYDRKTAIQMDKDAIELGEAFRDGDYYIKGLHEN